MKENWNPKLRWMGREVMVICGVDLRHRRATQQE
jgi:hypothetical protein